MGHKSDIIITNGAVEFEAHKQILESMSTFFKELFKGDSDVKEVLLPDVDDKSFTLLYDIIYATPEVRVEKLLSDTMTQALSPGFLLLISKYQVTIIREALTQVLSERFWMVGSDLKFFKILTETHKLDDLYIIAEGTHIRCRNEDNLKHHTFAPSVILKMIDAHDFSEDFAFFEKIVKCLKRLKSTQVAEKLRDVEIKGKKSWKQKFQFEKKKSAALFKFLRTSTAESERKSAEVLSGLPIPRRMAGLPPVAPSPIPNLTGSPKPSPKPSLFNPFTKPVQKPSPKPSLFNPFTKPVQIFTFPAAKPLQLFKYPPKPSS